MRLGLSHRCSSCLRPDLRLRRVRRYVRCLDLWPGSNYVLRVSAVHLGIRRSVDLRRLLVTRLDAGRSRVLVAIGNPLRWCGSVLNSARAAVIRNAVVVDDRVVRHNRPVDIGRVNHVFVHAHHRGVVGELVAAPLST